MRHNARNIFYRLLHSVCARYYSYVYFKQYSSPGCDGVPRRRLPFDPHPKDRRHIARQARQGRKACIHAFAAACMLAEGAVQRPKSIDDGSRHGPKSLAALLYACKHGENGAGFAGGRSADLSPAGCSASRLAQASAMR